MGNGDFATASNSPLGLATMIDEIDHTLLGKRILVLEDERLIALDVQDVLEALGCIVAGPVATVSEALNLIRDDCPDGAVVDVHLKNETSEPVANELRARGRPFLVVSAYQPKHLTGALKGAQLLNKPIDEKALRQGLFAVFNLDRSNTMRKGAPAQ